MYSGRDYRDSLVNKETLVSCSQEPHDFSHVRSREINGIQKQDWYILKMSAVIGTY